MTSIDTTYLPPASWVAAQLRRLPSDELRRAVVLTSSERLAHAIRRLLCVELAAPELLAGVVLLRPAAFARDLLLAAGTPHLEGWESLRRLRLLSLFLSGALDRQLRYFNAIQPHSSLGYANAFAATIHDLEAAGLDPALAQTVVERLAPSDERAAHRLHDVASVWQRVDANRGQRSTVSQSLLAAAEVVAANPALAAPHGPVLAVLTQSPSVATLRFLEALPECTAVLQEARPWRTGAQRWRSAVALAEPDELDSDAPREIELIQRYLFEIPEVLTDVDRPRSSGADGSVSIEQYAGIEDEVEAAANWASEQISRGVPLERIALIVPELGPYATELCDRLQRLPKPPPGAMLPDQGAGAKAKGIPANAIPVHVAAGSAVAATPAGLRLLAVLNALDESLDAPAVIRLLPMLRRPGQGNDVINLRLSPSRAAAIVYGAGIIGGNPRDPSGLNEWVPRLEAMRQRMQAQLQHAEAALPTAHDDRLEQRKLQIEGAAARQWLREVEPLLPAIQSLQHLGERVAADATLAHVWPELVAFCDQHLALPPNPPGLLAQLQQRVGAIVSDALGNEIRGRMAVQYLASLIGSETLVLTRFGTPAIFIGTPAQAAGLAFDAVRMLGLAEGGVPRTPHDDPILPDDLRRRLEEILTEGPPLPPSIPVVIPRLADRVLDDLHDVFRVMQGAQQTLALSQPRQWSDRSERESSGVLLEVATSLSRSSAGAEGDVPTAARLRAAYFEPDAQRHQQSILSKRRTPRALLFAVAQDLRRSPQRLAVPAGWERTNRSSALSILRLRTLIAAATAPELAAVDGQLAEAWASFSPPGLGERPISASALALLLGCPHRFLLERVLHLREPFRPPSSDAIDPIRYGELLHGVAQRFFAAAGAELCQRNGSVEEFVSKARALAHEAFDQFCRTYPLRGADSIERERERLVRQLEYLVRDEWQRPKRDFVATEHSFGQSQLLRVPSSEEGLHVWGAIDRIDRIDGGLSVRDIKTGRVHDFVEEPINAGRDLQLGLYVMALEQSDDATFGGKVVEAAYVHPSAAQEPERGFAGAQLDVLQSHTREWIRVARSLLRHGNFVRTSSYDDCRFCPFVPACGHEATEVSAAKLKQIPAAHELELFVRLKATR